MKKSLVALVLVSLPLFISAQTYSCTDLGTTNLIRGSESANVLKLQQFLYAKGILKATPNGYFGPATLASVKAYQKSLGLSQVGNTGPATRAAIKKESCAQPLSQGSQQPVYVATSSVPQPTITYQKPSIATLDKGTLFANSTTTWNVVIQGSAFDASENTVYFRYGPYGKKYTIGTFPSGDGVTITLPTSLMTELFPCGNNCLEKLSPGSYYVSVANKGGESDPIYALVQGFTLSSLTGSLSFPVKQNSSNVLLGTVTFSSSVPVVVTDIVADVQSEGLQSPGVSGFTFKNELTGQDIAGTSVYVSENESKIIGIYGSVDSARSGTIIGSVSLTVTDFIGNKPVTFVSPRFFTSVSGF